jgi:hypothetical protein
VSIPPAHFFLLMVGGRSCLLSIRLLDLFEEAVSEPGSGPFRLTHHAEPSSRSHAEDSALKVAHPQRPSLLKG